MESVLGRYRNLIVLVGVLFAQVLGLAVQVRRTTDNEPTRLIRIWAVGTVTPFERVLVWAQTSTNNLWHNYFYLRGVRAENRSLKAQIERMSLEQVRMSQDADQARRLQALLAFKEQFISKTMAAQVIGSSGSEQSRSVYIDKGSRDGVKTDMAVITAEGVVGKVLRVFRSTSQVLLVNDQTSGVGAILEKSRLQGVLRGTALGEVVLEKVMSDEAVQPGDRVLTSGGDQIFPKGLPVGTVTKVSPGSELFLNIRVKPAADLSRLEEVLVITQEEDKEPAVADSTSMRAADILAQRLPSIPDHPADDPNKPPPPTSGLKIVAAPIASGTPASAATPRLASGNAATHNQASTTAAPADPKPHLDSSGTTNGITSSGSKPVANSTTTRKTASPAVKPSDGSTGDAPGNAAQPLVPTPDAQSGQPGAEPKSPQEPPQ